MTSHRWHMNRAGLFNFWHYTDEVFQLSSGRLILRGANGSGKSVTMQSFLPLVLDGDKRSSRLDPFGSKDRKIDYYLLGDAESGEQDRTAYLYLEFAQTNPEKYLTVGIGLRARRGGSSPVQFWGFAITDQRRIGQDIWLYDRGLYAAHGQKVPLDRPGLEAVIASGGKVVREQGEYRNLVNQLLFGFADPEAYKELLALMIQLRSPKLSKDYRPSTIYTILEGALPPLSEEELRSLSDVLEDLDQISDRLEELARHRSEAEHLQDAYNRYNEMRLLLAGQRVVQAEDAAHEKTRQVMVLREEDAALQAQFASLSQQIAEWDARVHALDLEIELLEQSEAMEHLTEIEEIKERIAAATRDLERMQSQIARQEKELHQKRVRAQTLREQIADETAVAESLRGEMATRAQEVEFADHAVFEQGFSSGIRVESSLWSHLQRDIETQQKRIKQLRALLTRVRDQAERMAAAERAVSEARNRRDDRELQVRHAEKELREAIVRQEDALLCWRQGLLYLPLTDDAWRRALRALQTYPETPYQDVVAPVKEAHETERLSVKARRVEVVHERSLCAADIDRLQAEWDAWQKQREPEPLQSEATAIARERRRATALAGEDGTVAPVGAPLYTLCDFDPSLDDATKAMLETALHRAGLLDAWVGSPGFRLAQGEEDTWITPSPAYFVPTLADYLRPTPTKESGLTAELIEDVLRTIVMDDSRDDHPVRLSTDGTFQLGPLAGKVVPKERAEWIGVETRRQTRIRHMERLQADIETLQAHITVFDQELQALDEREAHLASEMRALPGEEDMMEASVGLREARWALEAAVRQVEVCSDQWKEAQRVLRVCQGECNAELAKWHRLQTEEDCDAALDTLQGYRERAGDLKSTLTILVARSEEELRLHTEVLALTERQAQDRLQETEYTGRVRDLRQREEVLAALVSAAGAWDLFERVQSRKAERVEARGILDETRSRRELCAGDRGRSEERLRQQELELADAERVCGVQRAAFVREWRWALVTLPDGSAASQEIAGRERDAARMVTRFLHGRYDGKRLQAIEEHLRSTFVIAKNTLMEYSLEQSYDEQSDRLLIASHRDRAHTMTPAALLAELRLQEEQQRILIDEKDRELYEHILLRSVGRAIRDKINRAEQWVAQMNQFMAERRTSSGLTLSLSWVPQAARNERELDTDRLVQLLRKSPDTLRAEEVDDMMTHFRSRIAWAKEAAAEGETLRHAIHGLLDYRGWFRFQLSFKKGEQPKRELTDSRFNVLSGGEKAMAMYIPLFAATDSRYKDSHPAAPRILSLDEAFAGVDEENLRDMFQLLTDMGFDYMMTSQQLWGCYDTVSALSIYEVHRPNDGKVITLIPYQWNGDRRRLMAEAISLKDSEVAASVVDS